MNIRTRLSVVMVVVLTATSATAICSSRIRKKQNTATRNTSEQKLRRKQMEALRRARIIYEQSLKDMQREERIFDAQRHKQRHR